MTNIRQFSAEALGTFLLVLFGVGSAVAGLQSSGVIVVALAFGLVLTVLAYAIGPVSGCHVNPAVTLGALLAGRLHLADAVGYWIAQVVGAVVASFGLWGLTRWGGVEDETGSLGTNGYGAHINAGGAVILETVLTFLLVLVVLLVTGRSDQSRIAGVAIGLALGVTNFVGIPLDGAGVNPARSLGPALFGGAHALSQVWVFLIFPLVGGLLAALVAPLVESDLAPFRMPGQRVRGQAEPLPTGRPAPATTPPDAAAR
jgi:aquaporin Z